MAVPTVQEFNDGKRDLDDLEGLINGASTVTTRLGGDKDSYDQYVSRIAHGDITVYSAATTYTIITDWVTESGVVYRPNPSDLPIGPEAFDANKWFAVQGYTQGDRLVPSVESPDDLLTTFPASLEIGTRGYTYEAGKEGPWIVTAWTNEVDNEGTTKVNGTWEAAGKYWRRDFQGDTLPTWFGLKGGIGYAVANVAAIQAALDSLPAFSNIFSSDSAGRVCVYAQTDTGGNVIPYEFDTTAGEIIIDAGCTLVGDKTAILRLVAGTTLLGAKDRTTQSNQHITIKDLTIDKDSSLSITGTTGLDLLNCSYFELSDLRIRTFEKGIIAGGLSGDAVNGGFYNNLNRLEVANCDWAVYTDFEFNSNKIIGGRYLSNKVGIRLKGCSDNLISAAFEKTNLGIEFGDGSRGNTVTQCRFESCGRGQGGGGAVDFLTGGAMYFDPGSFFNNVQGGHYSGSGDRIIDEGYANVKNGVTGPGGGVGSGYSNNLWSNPAMDADSDSDGIADGLSITTTTGVTPSIDTTNKRIGLGSQQISIDATNTVRRDALATINVVPDQTYTISVLTKTTLDAGWNLRSGLTSTGTEFVNIPISQTAENGDGFNLIQVTFKADSSTLAGQEFIYITFFMNSGTIGTVNSLWVDFIGVYNGVGGSITTSNIVPDTKNLTDIPTANLPQGSLYYNGQVERILFVDSAGGIRNASGRKIENTNSNVAPASTITLPGGRNVVSIDIPGGATNIDNITADDDATVTLLVPSSLVTITDAGNKRLNGAFVGGVNDTITLACSGSVWYEVSRSAN